MQARDVSSSVMVLPRLFRSGTLDAELQEGDTVMFISTLHGG